MSAGDYFRAWRETRDRLAEEAAESEATTPEALAWDRLDRIEERLGALDLLLDGIEEALTGRPAVQVTVNVAPEPDSMARELFRQSQAYLGPG